MRRRSAGSRDSPPSEWASNQQALQLKQSVLHPAVSQLDSVQLRDSPQTRTLLRANPAFVKRKLRQETVEHVIARKTAHRYGTAGLTRQNDDLLDAALVRDVDVRGRHRDRHLSVGVQRRLESG